MRTRIPIEEQDAPSHILGAPVWEKTSIFRPAYPFTALEGRIRSEGKLYYSRRGQIIRRNLVEPADPKTPLQLDRRAIFGSAQKHWRTLNEELREKWKQYALVNLPQKKTSEPNLAGFNGWCATQTYRRAMGGEFATAPPAHGVPLAPLAVTQEAAPCDTSFAFRVEHSLEQVEGMRLLVEISRAMPTLKRKPRVTDLRWATTDSRCFLELQPSGSVYLLENARFGVAAGQRYGVAMRLVTSEGVASCRLRADFLKTISTESLQAFSSLDLEVEPEMILAELAEMLASASAAERRAIAQSLKRLRSSAVNAGAVAGIARVPTRNGEQSSPFEEVLSLDSNVLPIPQDAGRASPG